MVQKFYVNPDGSYCGSLTDIEPEDAADPKYLLAIEVDSPPPSGDARQMYDLVNMVWLPLPEDPPQPYTLQMSDFWSRFVDDDEYELFDAALAVALPAKDRRAFNSAQFLRSDSLLFIWGRAVLVSVVGEGRTEVIMAESPTYTSRPSGEDQAVLA